MLGAEGEQVRLAAANGHIGPMMIAHDHLGRIEPRERAAPKVDQPYQVGGVLRNQLYLRVVDLLDEADAMLYPRPGEGGRGDRSGGDPVGIDMRYHRDAPGTKQCRRRGGGRGLEASDIPAVHLTSLSTVRTLSRSYTMRARGTRFSVSS